MRNKWLVGAGLAVVAGGVWYAVTAGSRSTTGAASPPAESAPAQRVSGVKSRYRFTVEAKSVSRIDGQGGDIAGAFNLEAGLEVTVSNSSERERLFVIRVVDVAKQAFVVNDAPVSAAELETTRKALLQGTALVRVDAGHKVVDVKFSADSTGAAIDALGRLASAFSVARVAGDVAEDAPDGRRVAHYEVVDDGTLGHLRRTTTAYESFRSAPTVPGAARQVAGAADIRFDSDGYLASVDEQEQLELRTDNGTVAWESNTAWKLERQGAGTTVSLELPAKTVTAPTASGLARRLTPDELRARDLRLSKNVTIDSMRTLLATASKGGTVPEGEAFRVSAFLRAHPEACATVVADFKSGLIAGKGHGLGLDVLMMAGHETAQAAMREVLSLPALRKDARQFPYLVQRFVMLDTPSLATVEYIDALATQGASTHDAALERASSSSLGAMLHHLARKEPAKADEFDRRLLARLTPDATRETKVAVLTAAGNAGSPRDVKAMLSLRNDTDLMVREQTANSLRNIRSDEVRGALLELARDADWSVQRTALHSLQRQDLVESDWKTLRADVGAGRIDRRAYSEVIDVVGTHRDAVRQPEVRAMLEQIAGQTAQGEPVLRDRVKDLLAVSTGR